MKITKKHNDGTIPMGELSLGNIFYSNNNVYIRCPEIFDSGFANSFQAVNLATGVFHHFTGDERVRKIENAELIVEF